MWAHAELFWVRVENSDDLARLRLTGRLDSTAVSYHNRKIDDARGRDVVLDLGGITYVDASAWLAVMSCERRVRAWGGSLRLENATGSVREVFQADGTGHLMPGTEDR
jgi:anti-anti-sigma factor